MKNTTTKTDDSCALAVGAGYVGTVMTRELAEADHQRLVSHSDKSVPGMSALEWLLAHPSKGKRSKHEIDRQLHDERSW